MKKFTKLLFLLILEFIIAALFLGVSENADLASAIIFPPIFAITLYFLIFTTLEVENKSKKVHVIFALLLASKIPNIPVNINQCENFSSRKYNLFNTCSNS